MTNLCLIMYHNKLAIQFLHAVYLKWNYVTQLSKIERNSLIRENYWRITRVLNALCGRKVNWWVGSI